MLGPPVACAVLVCSNTLHRSLLCERRLLGQLCSTRGSNSQPSSTQSAWHRVPGARRPRARALGAASGLLALDRRRRQVAAVLEPAPQVLARAAAAVWAKPWALVSRLPRPPHPCCWARATLRVPLCARPVLRGRARPAGRQVRLHSHALRAMHVRGQPTGRGRARRGVLEAPAGAGRRAPSWRQCSSASPQASSTSAPPAPRRTRPRSASRLRRAEPRRRVARRGAHRR